MGLRLHAALVRTTIGLLATVVVASLLSGVASAQPPANTCPEAYPVANLTRGQMATGFTTAAERDVEEFDVEILGVMENGIAPGKDLIFAEASGGPIDAAGGIWAGMSGSPVYLDDKLVGAVAYGFSFGPSPIHGITPAEDMYDILDYASASTASESAPRRIKPSASAARTIAQAEGESGSAEGSFKMLKTPFALGGVSAARVAQVSKVIHEEKPSLIPYAGSTSSSALQVDPVGDNPAPGEPFLAGLSYGDVNAVAGGTTTAVCDEEAVAFGHPFFFQGRTTLGANAGNAITVIDDPTLTPYRIDNVAEPVGTVDQDRFSGIRAQLVSFPDLIPVTSTVTALDSGRTRNGETGVVISEFVPGLAFSHAFSNIDSVFDQIDGGSSSVTFTVEGTREGGAAWAYSRTNMFTSEFDISFESLFELESHLARLFFNPFEEIEFLGVDIDVTLEEEVKEYVITDLLHSKNGVDYSDGRKVKVRPGDTIYLRVELESASSELADRTVDMSVVVPNNAQSGGSVEVSGAFLFGGDFFFFEGQGSAGSGKVDSLNALLAKLAEEPKNNELYAKLKLGRRKAVFKDVEVLDNVVRGFEFLNVRLKGAGGEGIITCAQPCEG